MDGGVGRARPRLSTARQSHRLAGRFGLAVAAIVPVGFLALFYFYPMVTMLARGLDRAALETANDRVDIGAVLRFTVWQALLSTGITIVLGLAVAGLLSTYRFRGSRLLRAASTVPFVLPTTVVGAAFVALAERLHIPQLADGFSAVIASHVFFNIAVVVRLVGVRWRTLDQRRIDAARSLGISRLRRFTAVVLPHVRTSLISAAALVFLFCFTSFGVILILGGPGVRTIETEIYRFAITRNDPSTAAVLSVLQLTVVVALTLAMTWLDRRRTSDQIGARPAPLRRPASQRERLLLRIGIGLSAALLLAPIAVLIERSFRVGDGYGIANYSGLGDRPIALPVSGVDALVNSTQVAVVATLIAAAVGAIAAVIVSTDTGPRFGPLAVVLMLPLGTSAVTLGFGLLIAFDSSAWNLRSRWIIIPIAHALIGIPFVMRATAGALRAVPPSVRESARTLGASPRRVRTSIDAPLVRNAAAVGASFAFAVSIGEFGATSFLARRPDQTTVPQSIFRLLGRPGEANEGQAMALATLLMLLIVAVVVLFDRADDPRSAML